MNKTSLSQAVRPQHALFLFPLLLLHEDIRILYAPFAHAPRVVLEFLLQAIVLCCVHLLFVSPTVFTKRFPPVLFLCMHLASVNIALNLCARLVVNSVVDGQAYLVAYHGMYLLLLAVSALLWWWRYHKNPQEKPLSLKLDALALAALLYFVALYFTPLFQIVDLWDGNMWGAFYAYHMTKWILIAILLMYVICEICKICKRLYRAYDSRQSNQQT